MKIAIFTDSYTPYVSGVVRSIQRFSTGLKRLGHDVYVFAPAYGGPHGDDKTDSSGAVIYRFHSLRAPTCRGFSLPIPISPRADRFINQLGIDVIHSHSPFLMGQLSANLSWRTGIPLVFTHHTMYHQYVHYIPAPRTMTRQMVIRFLQHYCRQCDHLIAPTAQFKEMMQSLYNIHVPISSIPTGVDLTPYDTADSLFLAQMFSLPQDTDFLLFVGRLGREKNPQLVLDAFKRLASQFPGLHHVFVGDGPERQPLTDDARKNGLAERVHFTGVLTADEVVSAYASATAFVFGSVTETQGLVTVEAMAAGTPVVAVRATGSEDMVEHGYNGFLTENTADSLSYYTKELLENEDVYRRMRRQALLSAQEFSLTGTAKKLLQVYDQVVQGPKQPHWLPRMFSKTP